MAPWCRANLRVTLTCFLSRVSFPLVRQSMLKDVKIDGVRLKLSSPLEIASEWIGQREILHQLMACWLVVDDKDLPLTPRLVGAPGIGKTALGTSAARQRNQELYIYQCTADTRP